jgi:exosortase
MLDGMFMAAERLRQDRGALTARLALVLSLTVLLWPAVGHAIEVWSTDEEFTYGFLVIPIAIGILWWRRAALRASLGRGSAWGLGLVVLGVLLTLLSRRIGINALAGIAVTPLLIGVVWYLWGARAARVVAFPCIYLIFGLGLYRGLLSSVGFGLQELTAHGAGWAGQTLGLPVLRDGLILHSSSAAPTAFAFVVAQACSGMSSLLSLLSLAALWIYATRGPGSGKAIVLLGVAPLVIMANTTRVTLVLVVGATLGQDAALGFFHGVSSLLLFGIALSGLLGLGRIVGCRLPTLASSS